MSVSFNWSSSHWNDLRAFDHTPKCMVHLWFRNPTQLVVKYDRRFITIRYSCWLGQIRSRWHFFGKQNNRYTNTAGTGIHKRVQSVPTPALFYVPRHLDFWPFVPQINGFSIRMSAVQSGDSHKISCGKTDRQTQTDRRRWKSTLLTTVGVGNKMTSTPVKAQKR